MLSPSAIGDRRLPAARATPMVLRTAGKLNLSRRIPPARARNDDAVWLRPRLRRAPRSLRAPSRRRIFDSRPETEWRATAAVNPQAAGPSRRPA